MHRHLALAFSAALACVAAPASADLRISCIGGGNAEKLNMGVGWVGGATAGAVGSKTVGYQDEVAVEVVNGEGKIRLPRVLLPPAHGGKDGWFEMRDMKETDREITASAAVNFITRPKIRLDRYSGVISIDTRNGTFTAQCRKIEAQERQF